MLCALNRLLRKELLPDSFATACRREAVEPWNFGAVMSAFECKLRNALAAFKTMRSRLRNPAFTPEMLAAAMERNSLVATAQRLREASDLI